MPKDLYVEAAPTPPADLEVGDVYWFSSYNWTFLLSNCQSTSDPERVHVTSILGEVWSCDRERADIHRVLPTSDLWVVTDPASDKDYEFGPAVLNRCKQYKREKGRGLDLVVQRYNGVEVAT